METSCPSSPTLVWDSYDVRAYAQTDFPEAKPAWEPNEAEGRDNLHRYRKVLTAGLKEGEERS
jgi:hypothetical protein